MKLGKEIKEAIDSSVLCWLATSSKENIPNVSPKEIYTHYKDEFIIVANIASPQTVKNIKENKKKMNAKENIIRKKSKCTYIDLDEKLKLKLN